MKPYSILLVLFVAISSCAQNNNSTPTTEPVSTSETKPVPQQGVVNLSQADFKKSFEGKDGLQIVDVRTPGEIAGGKIGEALELDINDPKFVEKIDALNLDKSKPVVVYCAAGGRSAKASQIFLVQGFTTIYNLIGGYNAYKL
jgi:rhodanese-related sulfurtransferase